MPIHPNFGFLEDMVEHFHAVGCVYPTLASGVQVAAVNDAGSWTLGTAVEIMLANTAPSVFDIHHILIENASADTTYCMVLYGGLSDIEVGRIRFTRDAGGGLQIISTVPFMTPLIQKTSRIRARVATPGNNGETVTISLFYHCY